MSVDITGAAENLSKTFTLDAGQVEMEITLQNDLHLKAYLNMLIYIEPGFSLTGRQDLTVF